ncbi:MAG: phosphoribosylformylglycinamidine synthase [Cyclobacteriaceae bacterium]|nr:MAG: phosphoribosylformylglycinamidine synthase [Cyclobacteriaceae bacterium]
MICFFLVRPLVYAIECQTPLQTADIEKLTWLLGGAALYEHDCLKGTFVGPRREMVTPWSTNAVEITRNMGIAGIVRMEMFTQTGPNPAFDRMLQAVYTNLDQHLFTINITPEPVKSITNIRAYNEAEGLALSEEETDYLEKVSKELGRPLTDSEIFGFSQVNSEHCRHKIFNGTFIINGKEQPQSLFQLIKNTSRQNPNLLVSAYRDNVAFFKGPRIVQFAPLRQDEPAWFAVREIESVISLKAETHNFPTTVEPFNGAATGTGGEIRDRLAGGRGALPLAGTAVYMTSYPRLAGGRAWEKINPERKWLYQTPLDILIKASDGASDFGNKFGQPLIAGSVLTFEYINHPHRLAYDKVVMLAGGIGFAKKQDSVKEHLKPGDKIVLLGGDNYRIGMGGGAVSSVATGQYGHAIELNAIQRSNPEMQKRVMNAIRALAESDNNPIVSIHDHGAGGHFNCLAELLEETGGTIDIDALPVGDPTLSVREILSNESQERMGLAISPENLDMLQRIASRERAPFYIIGEATGNKRIQFVKRNMPAPVDLEVRHLLGSSPKTILHDEVTEATYKDLNTDTTLIPQYLEAVLQLESVACKDWLTNKVDRSVTGKVALQQTCGQIQLPLNNTGVMALDYHTKAGVATAIGHAPIAAILDPAAGSRLAITEALTNLVWAPLAHGLKGVSLSANWMWPAKKPGENARLYQAVQAASEFAIALGINIPTGKDSLSMTQRYPDGTEVKSPGTVIISAAAEVADVSRCVSPALLPVEESTLIWIDFSGTPPLLGGSALAQVTGAIGSQPPDADAAIVVRAFNALQQLIASNLVLAGHDVSAGGLITTVLEMCFPTPRAGADLNLGAFAGNPVEILFAENPAVVIQTAAQDEVIKILDKNQVRYEKIGKVNFSESLSIRHPLYSGTFAVPALRNTWFTTSYLLDSRQRPEKYAQLRYENFVRQPLEFNFPPGFSGTVAGHEVQPIHSQTAAVKAAIIREKGVNGDREMAFALYLAGFEVKDVHMTDLVSGKEDLSDVQMIVFVGGFSNSDVLGSAKGWAGAFRYNPRAQQTLEAFYSRPDTLSLGVCNGCQLMMELGLLYPEMGSEHPRMHRNGSGKFESAFLSLTIPTSNSVMLQSLAGSTLGVWIAHGEGRFILSDKRPLANVAARYTYPEYPGNPNDSEDAIAALCSADGRHLAIMPHLERSLFPWNWAFYPPERKADEITPWIEAFVNARKWLEKRVNKNS